MSDRLREQFCLQKLTDVCSNEILKSTEGLTGLKALLGCLTESNSCIIKLWIKLQEESLPLDCLWQLQCFDLLQFTTYIYYHADWIPQVSERFEKHIWWEDEDLREQCSETVAGLLGVLVNLGAHTARDICVPGQQLLTLVLKQFVSRLLREPPASEEPVPFLSRLLHGSACVQSRLQVFCLSVLRAMVQCTPDSVTLEEAVRDQTNLYTSAKTSPVIRNVYSEVLSRLSTEDVNAELMRLVSSPEVCNWRWLLVAVSVHVTTSPDGADSFKGVVEGWLTQACVQNNTRLLSAALLCARQCCAESLQRFGSYASWFGSLQVRPASSFVFLFNFLSQLVPYEPVLYLKIHVNKVPSAPANCHSVVADYVALAKTRLADLNQTTDYMGLFGEYTTSEQDGREADVAKVVAHYKKTKEVMKIVLEASVFRRQFYEKVFLAELLKDGNTEYVEFIEKLYKIGKIPFGMYNRWKQLYFK